MREGNPPHLRVFVSAPGADPSTPAGTSTTVQDHATDAAAAAAAAAVPFAPDPAPFPTPAATSRPVAPAPLSLDPCCAAAGGPVA